MKVLKVLTVLTVLMVLALCGEVAAASPAESERLGRAKDFIADERWTRAIAELRVAVADRKEPARDEAAYWLAHSLYQAGEPGEALTVIEALERERPRSLWVKPARSLRIEIAHRLNRKDLLWKVATPPPPPPAPAPVAVGPGAPPPPPAAPVAQQPKRPRAAMPSPPGPGHDDRCAGDRDVVGHGSAHPGPQQPHELRGCARGADPARDRAEGGGRGAGAARHLRARAIQPRGRALDDRRSRAHGRRAAAGDGGEGARVSGVAGSGEGPARGVRRRDSAREAAGDSRVWQRRLA